MSLSEDPAFTRLQNRFVCGYRDITGEPWAGRSGIHNPDGNAFRTTNGAGPHNVQLFVLAPDGTVLTCLPGYWNAQDLTHELDLAEELLAVHNDASLTSRQKAARFTELHLNHPHSWATTRRSRMQGFDRKFEARRGSPDASKTTDALMHERMARRPFLAYTDFDTAAYSDYGRPKYDKHEDRRPIW